MPLAPAIDTAVIVIRGRFNPAIFQPAWLAAKNLVREQEAEIAMQQPNQSRKSDVIITNAVTSYNLDWLQLQVDEDAFVVRTSSSAHFEPLRDFAVGVFSILEHTPVAYMGINRLSHYKLESEAQWHALGDHLAPKEIWKPLFANRPGMRSLVIEAKRPGSDAEYIRIKVEPSDQVAPFGVYVESNEHFKVVDDSSAPTTAQVVEYLRSSWATSMDFASTSAAHVLDSVPRP